MPKKIPQLHPPYLLSQSSSQPWQNRRKQKKMFGCTTMKKRVTYPLDEKVKARIIGWDQSTGYASSGSEHSSRADDDVASSTLSDIFFGFGIHDDGESSPERYDFDSEREPSMCDSIIRNVDLIKPILLDLTDEFQNVITVHVSRAVEQFSCIKSDEWMLRRNVMVFLRDYGYNAAICKTKWESYGGLTAGNYEFIDVVRKDSSVRYFVDLEFASEFEIARPMNSYERLLQCLPKVFVGKIDCLREILKIMSDASKRSLKSRGLHLPPWRKHRFMQNKWLGPYRRTTNLFPATFSSTAAPLSQGYAVKRCAVGFDDAVNDVRLQCPSTAPTR